MRRQITRGANAGVGKKMLHEAIMESILQGELGTDGMDWIEEGSEMGEKEIR